MATVMTSDDATLNALNDVSHELAVARAKLEVMEAKFARIMAQCDASTFAAAKDQAAHYEHTGYHNVYTPLLRVSEVRAILEATS